MLSWQGKSGLSAVLTLMNENNIMITSISPVRQGSILKKREEKEA